MKKLLSILLVSLFLGFGAGTAMAGNISINPTGELYALPGDELTFTVDFEANPAVEFGDAYAFNIGFDVGELFVVSWANVSPGEDWNDFGNPNLEEPGFIRNFNGYLNFGAERTMIGDVQLGTVTFELLAGASIDGNPDVWFIQEDGFTTIGYIDPGDSDPTCHPVDEITGHVGADVSAVPIPGAIWLLGSGLLGLIGLRRRAV